MTAQIVSAVSPVADATAGADAALQALQHQARQMFDQAAQQVRRLDEVNAPGAEAMARAMGSPARIGEAVADGLGRYQQRTAAVQEAMAEMQRSPADPHETAMREILPGPAELQPAAVAGTASPQAADDAEFRHLMGMVTGMFNYGVETQLVVKVGTQFSSTVNTLLKAQ